MTLNFDDFQVLETISTGEFGSRQKILRISDGKLLEWREIKYKTMDDALKEMVIYEINSLKKLRHPYVIHHEDAIIKRKSCTLYLITECCGIESLQTVIDLHKQNKALIKEDLIWSILNQLTQALHSLTLVHDPYRSQIFHRCLKPASVFFNSQTQKIKIGDFGLGLISKPHYMCPELQKLGLCNEKSDVWSMGCIIYEMCTLKRPFRELELDCSQLTDWKIGNIPGIYSYDLYSILKFILTPDEETRPSPLMVLHHPIIKARKAKARNLDVGKGVLETEFPVSTKENLTVITEDSLEMSAVNCSDLSLNRYLSMMSDQDASTTYIDDVDIQSIENGTAHPKATSSVLHCSPSPMRDVFDIPCHRREQLMTSTESSRMTRKFAELCQLELQLSRWAKMLEEKDQELAHKENRLQLWEMQLKEMQKFGEPLSHSNNSHRNSLSRQHSANETSGVETDMDSTASVYPCDSILEPTAVRMEPSKIQNPFTRHQMERRVRFQRSNDSLGNVKAENVSQGFAEQRLRWLEMKKRKHLATTQVPPALPPKTHAKLETDYIFMEEKSIPLTTAKKSQSAGLFGRLEPSRILKDKENCVDHLAGDNLMKGPPLPPRPSSVKSDDSKVLSNELRAKLKSHNLPGLR